jgi:signal transduction histidine kinase
MFPEDIPHMRQSPPEPKDGPPIPLSEAARQSLAGFLRRNRERAIAAWEHAIRAIPAAAMLDVAELRDHMPSLIDRVLALVETPGASTLGIGDLPEQHAIVRLQEGFNLEQVAWEYSALRSTLLRLNEEEGRLDPGAIVLLNDAIDQAVVRAVTRYHRARVRMLEALDRIAQEGLHAEPRALEALLHRLLQVIMDTVEPVDTAVLFLREWDRLVVRAAAGLEQEVEGKFSLAMGEGFAGMVARRRKPLITHSAETDALVRNPVLRMTGVKALYGVPLIYGDEVIGVAKMGSRRVNDFAADDRQILRSAADRAAAFIANRRHTDDRELLLHVLGHDLRSPLNTIVFSASGARQNEPLSPVLARAIDGDLTDFTQTTATGTLPLSREKLDMRDLVTLAAREIQGKTDRELRLHCHNDLTGEWDRGRILRTIVNLVNNALAYGAPSTPVTVRAEGDDSSVTLRVHNEGEPIAKDLWPHLFEAFRRGNRGAGSGLGLFIVQQIARAHGGSVEVESSEDKGTTFSVRLPRATLISA